MVNNLMTYALAKNVPIYLCENVMCRLCGCTGNNTSYILLKESCYLIKMIQDETQVKIKENDIYPKTVCRGCVDKIHIIQHFRSHCKKTQKVLETMYGANNNNQTQANLETDASLNISLESSVDESCKTTNSELLNNIQPDDESIMVEEWLEDEYSYESIPSDTLNQNKYAIIYEDTNTFKNVHVTLREEKISKDVTVVPYKILGQTRKKRVEVVSKERLLNPIKLENTNSNSGDKTPPIKNASPEILNENLYLKLNECESSSPIIYRLLTNKTNRSNKNVEIEVNKTTNIKSEAVIVSDDVLNYTQNEDLDTQNDIFKDNSDADRNHSDKDTEPMLDTRVDRSGRIFQSTAHKYVDKVSEKKYQCMICEKLFRYPFQVELHVRKHIGEKPFSCKECGKSFITGFYLLKHEKIHTNRQFICEVCGKHFRESYTLRDHQRIHLDVKPSFTCDHCHKTFYTKTSYDGHKLTHAEKKHVCEICGKRFSLHTMLNRHRSRHGNEKFYCQKCPKVLKTKEEFRQHKKRHERNGLYNCIICTLSFWTRKGLHMHERATHKNTVVDNEY